MNAFSNLLNFPFLMIIIQDNIIRQQYKYTEFEIFVKLAKLGVSWPFLCFLEDLYKWKVECSEKCKTTKLCQRVHVFGKVLKLKGSVFLKLQWQKTLGYIQMNLQIFNKISTRIITIKHNILNTSYTCQFHKGLSKNIGFCKLCKEISKWSKRWFK